MCVVWAVAALACAPAERPSPALLVAAGTMRSSASTEGVALLAAVTGHADGDAEWYGQVRDEWGANLADLELRAGLSTGFWWSNIPARVGSPYTLDVRSRHSGTGLTATFVVSPSDASEAPLLWHRDGMLEAEAEGATFHCLVRQGTETLIDAWLDGNVCPLGSLPPGTYVGWITALSHPAPVGVPAPGMWPSRFDVVESELPFVITPEGESLTSIAHGGAINLGSGVNGLAVAVELSDDTGLPTTGGILSISGPGIPVETPLELAIPPATPRYVAWNYDAPAAAGHYGYTLTFGDRATSGQFVLSSAEGLPLPTSVDVIARPSGAAEVVFSPVDGAINYYVSVWERATGALVSGGWTASTDFAFPPGTFESGRVYDTFVTASNVDLLGGTPHQGDVRLGENTYLPATFVGP